MLHIPKKHFWAHAFLPEVRSKVRQFPVHDLKVQLLEYDILGVVTAIHNNGSMYIIST